MNIGNEMILSRILEKLDSVQKRLNVLVTSRKDWKKPFLSVQELSQYMSMPVSTVYKISGKLLPRYKAGKRVLFKRAEVDNYIEKSRVASDEEIRNKAMTMFMKDGRDD